jgi:hypothetical protein
MVGRGSCLSAAVRVIALSSCIAQPYGKEGGDIVIMRETWAWRQHAIRTEWVSGRPVGRTTGLVRRTWCRAEWRLSRNNRSGRVIDVGVGVVQMY